MCPGVRAKPYHIERPAPSSSRAPSTCCAEVAPPHLKLSGTVRVDSAALKVLRSVESHVDVLVCDIGMPIMDGYQLLHAVRTELRLAPDMLPAVAVTAYARDEDRKRSLAAGFQAHLTKPYQVTQLVAILRALRQSADIH